MVAVVGPVVGRAGPRILSRYQFRGCWTEVRDACEVVSTVFMLYRERFLRLRSNNSSVSEILCTQLHNIKDAYPSHGTFS